VSRPEAPAEEIEDRIRQAAARRAALRLDTDAFRVFDGAGDGLGRLTVEHYAGALRATGGAEHAPHLEPIRRALDDPPAFFWRFGHDCTGPDGVDGARVVTEAGLRFHVELGRNRNTGLFLDGRPARRWVRAHAAERRVLNLFAYTCGFGVAAAAGGARATTNVDPVPGVLRRGAENYRLNNLPHDGRTFWRADALSALGRARRSGARFDGIVLDPPPVMTGGRRGRRTRPLDVLPRLAAAARAVLDPGGWLLLLCAVRGVATGELGAMMGLGEPIWVGTSGEDFRAAPGSERLRALAFERLR